MKRVLVPMDGSRPAESVLQRLTDVCDPGDEIVLISVALPPTRRRRGYRAGSIVRSLPIAPGITTGGQTVGPDMPIFAETTTQAEQRQLDELKDYLEHRAEALRKRGYKVSTVVDIHDSPGKAIVAYAKTMRPTFIALPRRSRATAIRSALFGSVASDLVRAGTAPILVYPPR